MRYFIFFMVVLWYPAFSQGNEKAIQLFEDRKFDEAAKMFSSVKPGHSQYAEARYYLGRISFSKQQYEEAKDYFGEAIEKNANVAEYHYWLGNAMGSVAQNANTFKQGMLAPKIKNAYEKTVELDPKHLGAHQGLIEFYTQAPGFMGGSWEKAEATARSMQRINKAEGHRAMGLVYHRQDKFDEAEKEYVASYKSDPSYIYVLTNFYSSRKQFDKVFTLFDEILRKNPDDMAIMYQYGKASALSGLHLDEGERYLQRYFSYTPSQNEPSHAGAYMRLGQIFEKKGQKPEAKKKYERAIQLDPTMKEAKEGLARVK